MIFTEKEERDGKTHFYPKIPASGAGGANGVMLDSSLSVKKTVTATGVKAPTITGGSSGGGGGGGGGVQTVWYMSCVCVQAVCLCVCKYVRALGGDDVMGRVEKTTQSAMALFS